jgi:hypothetical protein
MNTFSTHVRSKSIILLFISTLLLSNACTLFVRQPPPPPPPPNPPPVIESITADKTEIPLLTETQIVAKASDANGNTLMYQWSADGGIITGEGSSITWTAPATSDNYTIKVTVTDGKGGSATQSITIAAMDRPNHPPVISGLTIDGAPPLNENTAKGWVTKTINCNAGDPDGDQLSYSWIATGGHISGEGSTVSWTSPGVYGDYTVTVVVSDGRGGRAEGSVVFKVLCCGRG